MSWILQNTNYILGWYVTNTRFSSVYMKNIMIFTLTTAKDLSAKHNKCSCFLHVTWLEIPLSVNSFLNSNFTQATILKPCEARRICSLILGWELPYLGMVGRFRGDDPCFRDFQSDWVPVLCKTQFEWPPSFCRKKSVCLYHLFLQRYKNLNLVYFFTKMCYLTDFKHFVSTFSLIFNPIDSLFRRFSILVTPHFHKTLDLIVSKCFSCAEPGYKIFLEVPPPPRLPALASLFVYVYV